MTSIGLIGTEGIADAHLPAYRQYPERVDVGGVCDVDEEAAESLGNEFDVPVWTDYETFVEEADVEAVDIMTPTRFHAPMAKAGLRAGKHVLTEKPLARSVAEATSVVSTAEERDLRLMAAQCLRYNPGVRSIVSRTDEVGPFHQARLTGWGNKLPDGADATREGGGIVIELLVHDIDLLRYVVDDVERVSARTLSEHPAWTNGAEDYAVALLETVDGTTVDCFGTQSAAALPSYSRYEFAAESAVVVETLAGNPGPWIGWRDSDGTPGEFEKLDDEGHSLPTDDQYVNEILHFADCVDGDETPLTSGRDNLKTIATVEAIYESADRDGDWVDVRESLPANYRDD